MSNYAPYAAAATVTAGVLGSAYYIFQNRMSKIPTQWTEVGTLQNIYTYPIKSCGAITQEAASCTAYGLEDGWLRDRALMVVDNNNSHVTANSYPELMLVQATVRNSILTLNHRDMEPVYLNLAEVVALQSPKPALVCGVTIPVLDCGWEVSEWFSRLLDRSSTNFRLVYHATRKPEKLTSNQVGSFSKPYRLINEASIDELNTRLTTCQLSHRAFRPNFVLRSTHPFEEDTWRFLKIGENVFEVFESHTRLMTKINEKVIKNFESVFTTIDPETGVLRKEQEPLETLKSYRQSLNNADGPRMGLQLALRSGRGRVKLPDAVFAA